MLRLLLIVNIVYGWSITAEQKFSSIYRNDAWSNGSGPGSTPEFTIDYRLFLEKFLESRDINTVLDIGCGDWQFSKLINWSNCDYTGFDCVHSVIDDNKNFYSGHNIR